MSFYEFLKIPFHKGLGWYLTLFYMHIWIFVIGVLSGCEIPLLMAMMKERVAEGAALKVLGLDYIGTFLGAISFPFLTYQYWGLIKGAAITSTLNISVAAILVLHSFEKNKKYLWLCVLCLLINLMIIYFDQRLLDLFSYIYVNPTGL